MEEPGSTLTSTYTRRRKMKKRAIILPTIFIALATFACIFPVRTGSEAQGADIEYGISIGRTQAAATVLAALTETALAPPAQGTAEPTCLPGYEGCLRATYQSAFDSALRGSPTPSPVPTPSGPPLFTVVTRGSGSWTPNNLYNLPGVPNQLGYGTEAVERVVQLTHGVSLLVYDAYLTDAYYLVMITGWMELRDLASLGQSEFDSTDCVWHDQDHASNQALCHAHLYGNPESSTHSLIGVVEAGTTVRVLEVDSQSRMARVALPPLWIESSLTRPK